MVVKRERGRVVVAGHVTAGRQVRSLLASKLNRASGRLNPDVLYSRSPNVATGLPILPVDGSGFTAS